VLPVDIETQRAIWLVAIINSLGNTTLLLNGTFQAVSKFQFPLSLSIVHKLGLLLVAWRVPVFYDDIIPVLIGFIGVHLVILLTAWLLVNQQIVAVRLRFVISEWQDLIRESLPLAFSDLSLVANGRADSFLLGTMRSVSDVAIYGAAYNLYLGINGVINSLAVGVFPILSQRANTSKKSALRLSSRVGLVLLAATAVIAVVGILLSERIILLVYGPELLIAYPIFQILLLAVIFSSLGKLCHFTLISIRLQKLVFWATVTGMIFNVTANLVFIPIYGYTGAAYITLATEFIVFLFSFSLLLRQNRLENQGAVHVTELHP
jgi:O-antigen/teichoic acid export membrane protein